MLVGVTPPHPPLPFSASQGAVLESRGGCSGVSGGAGRRTLLSGRGAADGPSGLPHLLIPTLGSAPRGALAGAMTRFAGAQGSPGESTPFLPRHSGGPKREPIPSGVQREETSIQSCGPGWSLCVSSSGDNHLCVGGSEGGRSSLVLMLAGF